MSWWQKTPDGSTVHVNSPLKPEQMDDRTLEAIDNIAEAAARVLRGEGQAGCPLCEDAARNLRRS